MPSFGAPLGPKPGARKRANKLNTSGLGRSLVKQRERDRAQGKAGPESAMYTTDVRPDLRSVTQQRPLDEFLATAELADADFTSERSSNIKIVATGGKGAAATPTQAQRDSLAKTHYENAGKLTVPRRPHWTQDMTAHELDRLEKDAFLDWRRSLADLQDNKNLLLTPFERNIEVWRQLWRVVERSDLVVQIVDARNPLLYRSQDLDKYVAEVGDGQETHKKKNVLLLVNKADLLSESQRKDWQRYYAETGIRFAFFSAKEALAEGEINENGDRSIPEVQLDTPHILNVSQLEALFKQAAPRVEGQLQVGLVGYPNVGKSSTINALIGAKKVSVSATPGKTKHFQTIQLTSEMMLCDCPGLVFPNFAQTNADLVCNGVLPIDQLRDHLPPTTLVYERIPQFYLEAVYGISFPDDGPNALLTAYAEARGYTRTGGGPDTSRAARYVLKDYVNGKLLWCEPPPSSKVSPKEFNSGKFTLESLPEARQAQLIEAIKQKHHGELPPQIDLSDELRGLSLGTSSQRSSAALAGSEIDEEFFGGRGSRSSAQLPFHLQKQSGSSSKKHFKGRKGAQK